MCGKINRDKQTKSPDKARRGEIEKKIKEKKKKKKENITRNKRKVYMERKSAEAVIVKPRTKRSAKLRSGECVRTPCALQACALQAFP